jgi:hypothetical protein
MLTLALVISCSTSKNNSTITINQDNPNNLGNYDFNAIGLFPNLWKLQLKFEDAFYFNPSEKISLKASPASPHVNTLENNETFATIADGKNIIILVENKGCRIDKKTYYTKTVEIDFDGNKYKGCGSYTDNKSLYNVKWILSYINNEEQFALNYNNEIPFLEFNQLKNKLKGFDGSRHIECSFEVKSNAVLFEEFSIRKATKPTNAFALMLSQYVNNQLVSYSIKDGKLIFYLKNDQRLTFIASN